jgi:ABC-type multidrug transport system ATPase subunit
MELLARPVVLMLDEPTSGLSSADTEKVVEELRKLADNGCTVIATIHQPPPHVFAMFDYLAVVDSDAVRLKKRGEPGRLIFFGKTTEATEHFQALDHSGRSRQLEGGDAVLEAIEKNPQLTSADWERAFESSPIYAHRVSGGR